MWGCGRTGGVGAHVAAGRGRVRFVVPAAGAATTAERVCKGVSTMVQTVTGNGVATGDGVGLEFDAEVCLIGAGAAGLAAGKALADRGIAFDWFEKGSMVGGLWRIDNDNGGAAAYKTLHLNSSRPLTQYPSYPMPEDWPDYPSHEMIATYFQSFAEDNHLLERITFRTEVTSVEPLAGDGAPGSHGWSVTLADGQRRTYRNVMVANGHHGAPEHPRLPGEFTGATLHAHDYRDPAIFTDKDVVVVGVGNSGMDIACDAAKVAHRVYLVTRHGVHVIPKYAFGKPVDQLGNPLMAYIPFPVERTLYETIMRLSTGRPEDRGLPKPDHRLLHAHPTVSAELYDRVGHGDITMKPGIERLDGDQIRFDDGSVVHADMLVYATGYRITLPFLAPEVYDPVHNAMPLYQRVVSPDRPGSVLHRVHPDRRGQHPALRVPVPVDRRRPHRRRGASPPRTRCATGSPRTRSRWPRATCAPTGTPCRSTTGATSAP